MPYATLADLQARFGATEILQLTDRNADGQPDTDVIERALVDADSTIDSYIGTRYAVPMAEPIPAAVVAAASDLARGRLYDDQAPEIVTKRYDDTITWLSRIARGQVDLIGAEGRAETNTAPAVSTRNHGTRVFDRAALAGYTRGYGRGHR